MKRHPVKCAFQLFCLLAACGTRAGEVRLGLQGDRMTLQARDARLSEVLEAFAAYGIAVESAIELDTRVSLSLENERVDRGLDLLLAGHNHVTSWREYQVGGGKLHMLEGIRVVPDGPNPEAPRRVSPPPPRVFTFPDGTRARADEVVVGLAPGTTPEAFRALLASMGAHIIDADSGLGVYRLRLPAGTHLPDLLARLAKENTVAAVEPNLLWATPTPSRADTEAPAVLNNAPSGPAGSPALAIFDSGLHADYADAAFLRSSFDATGQGNTADPAGHGTQMALIGSGAITPLGLEPSPSLTPVIAIRSMEADGLTTSFGILKGLTHAREQGARVVGMSWGAYADSAFLEQAFAAATQQGILLVAAAGNDGRNELMYPASSPHVLSVGALNAQGGLWEKSNTGKGLDLLAPGEARLPIGHQGDPGLYAGTSIATAFAAGVLTRMALQHPTETPAQLLQRIADQTRETKIPGTEGARLLDPEVLKRLTAP